MQTVDTARPRPGSGSLLAPLIDSTDDVVWLVDAREHRLTAFNTAFATAVRAAIGTEARVGLAPGDLMPPPAAAEWTAFFERAVRDGPFTVEYSVPGTDRVMLHSFSPVRHGEGPVGVSVFGKDITARKRADEQRDRDEQQVLESQRLESLGRLAGGVAHDFNIMLGGIMGHADLLLADEANVDRREHLEAVLNAAKRSAELAGKLLAFGRRGKKLVEAVELNTIVRDCVAMLRPSIQRDVVVTQALKAAWCVEGDPSQFNQLVVNLCINANDAMPEGGTLTLATADVVVSLSDAPARGVSAGEFVALSVSDSGQGMTDEVKIRVFEPFFTTKVHHDTPGTGLGLSTVHGIVHLHQGAIAVESAPGRGTTFTVLIPRGRLALRPTTAAQHAPPGRGLILIVEDEAQLRRFVTVALERMGYQTLTAVDGIEAIRVFSERRGDITGILLDLKMPRMGGREAFIEIRAIDPSVAVLICSGYGDNEAAQRLITLGAKGLLSKPFRLAELAEQVAKLRPVG